MPRYLDFLNEHWFIEYIEPTYGQVAVRRIPAVTGNLVTGICYGPDSGCGILSAVMKLSLEIGSPGCSTNRHCGGDIGLDWEMSADSLSCQWKYASEEGLHYMAISAALRRILRRRTPLVKGGACTWDAHASVSM